MNKRMDPILYQYLGFGVAFGACFPIFSTAFEMYRLKMPWILEAVSRVHHQNPLLYIIDSAPFFLGIFALMAGYNYSKSEANGRALQQVADQLLLSQEKLTTEMEEKEKAQKEIEYLAFHDYLTQLPNRLLFEDRLNQAIFIAERTEKLLGVLFIDLCSFKMVNDTLGHDVGDVLLKKVAERLQNYIRKSDTVARVGGDEFLILAQNLNSDEDMKHIIEKLLDVFDSPFEVETHKLTVPLSIGAAIYPVDGAEGTMLIKNADIAMYKAKERGVSQYELCSHIMKEEAHEIIHLTNHLHRALERNELVLYYQPQVSSANGNIIGLEALIRWSHPEYGLVPPSKFISIAEKTGLILPIGEWVLYEACRQCKAWQDQGLPRLRMAINLSLKQLNNNDVVERFTQIITESGLEPDYLEFEITESVVMKEADHIIATLLEFKKMGISISIDDFGTVYSSLNYLKQLPVDRIKIAMPFVQGLFTNDKDEAITKAIIILAKNLSLGIIAEGVETQEQLEFLTEKNCDEIQGFYYYRPMPGHEIEKLLNSLLVDDEGIIS